MSIKSLFENLSKSAKSILLSFISQFSNSIIGFIMVPVLLGYLNKNDYGLWVTLVSLVGWIFVSDFGIGYGFRNRVTEYLADHDKIALNKHFKVTFQYYLIISFLILLFFIYTLNTNPTLSRYKTLSLIVYLPYIIFFPFSISNQILQGLRLVHLAGFLNLLRSILWAIFIICLVLSKYESNLYQIAIGYSIVNTIVNVVTVYLAIKNSDITFPTRKELLSRLTIDSSIIIGFKFFALQLSALMLFSMGNYFVYSNLTSSATATYDTINKVYSLYSTFFNIIISVSWSEIAFFRKTGDFHKLNSIYKKLLGISFLFSLGSILIAFLAPTFISLWTNNRINITSKDCIPFSFLVSAQAIAYVGSVFLNAFEKIMPQVIISIISIVLVYPLIKFGFQQNLGIGAVPIVCGILVIPALITAHYVAIHLIKINKVYTL